MTASELPFSLCVEFFFWCMFPRSRYYQNCAGQSLQHLVVHWDVPSHIHHDEQVPPTCQMTSLHWLTRPCLLSHCRLMSPCCPLCLLDSHLQHVSPETIAMSVYMILKRWFVFENHLTILTLTHGCITVQNYYHHKQCWLVFIAWSSYASAVLGIVILPVLLSVSHTCALWRNERIHCRYFDNNIKE